MIEELLYLLLVIYAEFVVNYYSVVFSLCLKLASLFITLSIVVKRSVYVVISLMVCFFAVVNIYYYLDDAFGLPSAGFSSRSIGDDYLYWYGEYGLTDTYRKGDVVGFFQKGHTGYIQKGELRTPENIMFYIVEYNDDYILARGRKYEGVNVVGDGLYFIVIKANDEFIGPMDDEGFVSTCASYGIVSIVVNKSNEYWKREAQL